MHVRSLAILSVAAVLYPVASSTRVAAAGRIVLTSPSFQNGGRLSSKFASRLCGGANVSPAVSWRGAPGLTQGYVLTMYDPEGRSGAGLWHWIVYDLPSTARGIASSADGKVLPLPARTGMNGHGLRGYFGPCPPPGKVHHYRFNVYALDEPYVQVEKTAVPKVLLAAMASHVLASGSLIGTYAR
jgi:Raf kinase inhibitor-like YbhB/YbcL family protein